MPKELKLLWHKLFRMKSLLAMAQLIWAIPALADRVFVGAGDIAVCGSLGDEKTAALLDNIPGTVFTLGDNVYEHGTTQEFINCYQQSWGRHKGRTKPAIGNHEYETPSASGYLDYFEVPKNYAYNLGDWHIVSFDSNCELAANGGCSTGSPTLNWLRSDLAVNSRPCTLVYFHHPRWSSNTANGGNAKMAHVWKIMYDAGVDVVLSGHSHSYERFAPMAPSGAVNWARGIRSFVVGTGGARLKPFNDARSGSQVRNGNTHGVLKLVLRAAGYSWRFIPVAGKSFTDSGSDSCH
jgi:hypothetical protein